MDICYYLLFSINQLGQVYSTIVTHTTSYANNYVCHVHVPRDQSIPCIPQHGDQSSSVRHDPLSPPTRGCRNTHDVIIKTAN